MSQEIMQGFSEILNLLRKNVGNFKIMTSWLMRTKHSGENVKIVSRAKVSEIGLK